MKDKESLFNNFRRVLWHLLLQFAHIIRWKDDNDEHEVNELPFSTFLTKNLCLKRVNESCSDIIT